jgi:hypothetical protein
MRIVEDIAEEGAIGIGVATANDDVGAGDHDAHRTLR